MKTMIRMAILMFLPTLLVPTAVAGLIYDEGYVYTNADIERLPPIPTGVTWRPRAQDVADWAFVTTFIAGERSKLGADRDHDLDRRRIEIDKDRPIGYGWPYPLRFIAPYAPNHRPSRRVADRANRRNTSPTNIPHPMFRKRPPVREFVPGLGDSYRPEASPTRH